MTEEPRHTAPPPPPTIEEVVACGGRYVSPQDGVEMVLIPAGEFYFGAREGDIFAPDDELPGRRVYLRAFLIDRDPVTNARFASFIAAGGYADRRYWSAEAWEWCQRAGVRRPASLEKEGFDAPDQPAAGVSWYEADAFARFAGKQLPTEAQWEKAARGTDARPFPWGEGLPRSDRCNFNSKVGRTTPPGRYPLGDSPYGLRDMSGNVNNWCRDYYWAGFYSYCARNGLNRDPCLDEPLRRSLGLADAMRADRGGGFATSFACWEVLRTSGRLAWPPSHRQLWHGFRCVIEL